MVINMFKLLHKPKLWIGKEVEGKFRGLFTLFIQGNANVNIIENCSKTYKITHLYFGAGKQSKINWKTVRHFIKNGHLITIDVNNLKNIPSDIYDNVHIMYSIKNKDVEHLKESDSIKIESNYVLTSIVSNLDITYPFEYKNDEEI